MRKRIIFYSLLKVVVEGIGEDKIFEGLELTADDWEEIEEYSTLLFKKYNLSSKL